LVDADVLEGFILFAIDEVVGRSHVEIIDVDTGSGVPDADEFVGLGIGKRLEKDAFEDAEDDGVAANAGGESDERDYREKGGACKAAENLFQVEHKRSHWRSLTGCAVE
jgi:hypothetical protein